MIVIDSASDSKLRIEVGVSAGIRYGDAVSLSIPASSDFLGFWSRSWEVWRSGDLAGAVLERFRSFLLRFMMEPERGDAALLGFVEGKRESRGDETAGVGEVALRCRL